ncbi:hypothetical protein ACFL3D_01930 [Candidatus Omnitrophota bacterium]
MVWETRKESPETAKECDWAENKTYTIFVKQDVWNVVKKLCAEVKVEWQMLLGGVVRDDVGIVTIDSYYIPEQEVGPASVKNNECNDAEFMQAHSIVCGIHSHADMNCHFSSTDEMTNHNIPFNIVVNNKLNYVAGHYMTLPCGLKFFINCELRILSEDNKIEVQGLDKIKKREFVTAADWRKDYEKRYGKEDWYTKYNDDIPCRKNGRESKRVHAFDFEHNDVDIADAITEYKDPVKDLPGQKYMNFGSF